MGGFFYATDKERANQQKYSVAVHVGGGGAGGRNATETIASLTHGG